MKNHEIIALGDRILRAVKSISYTIDQDGYPGIDPATVERIINKVITNVVRDNGEEKNETLF